MLYNHRFLRICSSIFSKINVKIFLSVFRPEKEKNVTKKTRGYLFILILTASL